MLSKSKLTDTEESDSDSSEVNTSSSSDSEKGKYDSDSSTCTDETAESNKYSKQTKRKKYRKGVKGTKGGWKKESKLHRRKGYPAYKGKGLVKHASEDRVETSQTSYSLGPQVIKTPLPAKIQWDGSRKGFYEYKDAIEGFYTQWQSSYLVDARFHELYVKH